MSVENSEEMLRQPDPPQEKVLDAGLTLAVYTADLWEHVCPVERIVGPAEIAGFNVLKGNAWETGEMRVYPERVAAADVVLIQRNFPSHMEAYEQVMAQAAALNKPVIYELDDLLVELPEQHPDYNYYISARTAILRAVTEADAVIGSTPALCAYLHDLNPNTFLFPNYLNDRIWSLRDVRVQGAPESGLLTIGYLSSHSHAADLSAVTPVLLDLLKRYSGEVQLKFWGITPPPELSDLAQVEWTQVGLVDYRQFAAYFMQQNCDLLIAPLNDNLFNRCKSHLKFLEYSALGIPGIYGRVTPYEKIVVPGENGFLAGTSDEWQAALTRLIESPDVRLNTGKAAQATLRSAWLLSDHIGEWRDFMHALAGTGKRRVAQPAVSVARKAHQWQAPLERRVTLTDAANQELQGRVNRLTQDLHNLGTYIQNQSEHIGRLDQLIAEQNQKITAQKSELFEKERINQEMDHTIQHIYALYQGVLNSRTWKLARTPFDLKNRLAPPGSKMGEVIHLGAQSGRVLRQEGPAALARAVAHKLKDGTLQSAPPAPSVPPVTPAPPESTASLQLFVLEGVKRSLPAIAIVLLKTAEDPPADWFSITETQIINWLQGQSEPSFAFLAIWDQDSQTGRFLGHSNQNAWPAADLKTFLQALPAPYVCVANRDLLEQDATFLEANLIALETERLAFTINLRGSVPWAMSLLQQGHLPGSQQQPLLRQIVRKDCVGESALELDLSHWLASRQGFAGVAGKVLVQTSSRADTPESLPFQSGLPASEFSWIGRSLVLRSRPETDWNATAHAIHGVESVLDVDPCPADIPTVLLLQQFLAMGGAERLALNIMRALSGQIRFVIVGMEELGPVLGTTADEYRQLTPYVYTVPDFIDPNLNFSMMERLIRRFQPQTLYIHNGCTWIYNALSELKKRYPDLRVVNQVYDHQVGWICRYDLDLVLNIDAHIAANPNIVQAYLQQGVPSEQVFFVEHCINDQENNPADYPLERRLEIKKKLGLPLDRKIVTFAARLHPQKRPMDFVELARRLALDDALCFLMVGDGILAEQVEAQIARVGLKNLYRQKFYRPISEIYAVTDVMVLPSEYEAMPLVIAETQAMGKPVVVNDVGNNREVVELTGGGYVVSQIGDVSGLMTGVRKMLENPPDAQQVRRAILSRFGMEVISRQYRDVILGKS